MNPKKNYLLLITLITGFFSYAQIDSAPKSGCPLRISLLTCTPGTELYSTFGHSALRVVDNNDSTDIIFNYGTFDFNDPDFYKKFTLGKLLYILSIEEFPDFVQQYQYEGRGITEQELNLGCAEKEKLLSALFENAKEENKFYKYDFVYDNCTTRLRDMVARISKDSLITKNIRPGNKTTFRNLIHEYLDRNKQYWSKLGIDILLGQPIDKKITNAEAMFLPDYLLKAFDSTTAGGGIFVLSKKTILDQTVQKEKSNFLTPLFIFSLLFVIVVMLSFINNPTVKLILRFFDVCVFFICGVIGLLILFMWLGTEHQACRNNFNLLWALPTHLPAAFLLFNKNNRFKKYFRFCCWIYLLLIPLWFFLPQQLNVALLPIIGILTIRSYFLSKKNATEAQKH